MASINELALPEINDIFIPNDIIHKGTSINDFKRKLFNTNGEFLDWDFNSLESKYAQHLSVEQGSISYVYGGVFVLTENTILHYRLTNDFPKQNISIKLNVTTLENDVSIELGDGFQCNISPSVNGGLITYQIQYEDSTITTFPDLSSYTFLLETFNKNEDNEYLFYIDNENDEFYMSVNGFKLDTNTFSSLKNLKLTNQSKLRIVAGSTGDIKLNNLLISETHISLENPSGEVLFSLKVRLVRQALVFYDMLPANVTNALITDTSLNENHLDLTIATVYDFYKYDSYFNFEINDTPSVVSIESNINNVGGIINEIAINMWFNIKVKNTTNDFQPILVLGELSAGSNDGQLSVKLQKFSKYGFKLIFEHLGSDSIKIGSDVQSGMFLKQIWYNVVIMKDSLNVYTFYVNGDLIHTEYHTRDLVIDANTSLKLGRSISMINPSLTHTKLGVISIYERLLLIEEIRALYDDYKNIYQNIPLISDAIAVYDLTNPDNVTRDQDISYIIADSSGNDNTLYETGGLTIDYVNNNSLQFGPYLGNNMIGDLHILTGNVSNGVTIWLKINRELVTNIRNERIWTIGSGETQYNSSLALSLVCTDTYSYALEFGAFQVASKTTDKVLFPDIWYHITVTRNVGSFLTHLFIDGVQADKITSYIAIDIFDSLFILGAYMGAEANYTGLSICDIGTVNIYERALAYVDIQNIYALYNTSYLLKNAIFNIRISDFVSSGGQMIADQSGNGNSVQLYFIEDSFDGISLTASDTGDANHQQIKNLYVAGINNHLKTHTFNVWFKLSNDAEGLQQILGYGENFYDNNTSRPHVVFQFDQVGNSEYFESLIYTNYTAFTPTNHNLVADSLVKRNVWYFYSYQRDAINDRISLSVNGGLFQNSTYINELSINESAMGINLGKILTNIPDSCLCSYGNFSLFDRALSLSEIQNIYNQDVELYTILSINPPDRDDRKTKPPTQEPQEPDPPFNSVWEINFDASSLAVDKPVNSGVFSSVPFQGNYSHTAHDGYVVVTDHIELDTGFPSVLNYGKSQTWILNFNTTVPDNSYEQMILSTSADEYSTKKTGVFIQLANNSIEGIFYSDENIEVGNTTHDFGDLNDLENLTHSYVLIIDYETSTIRAYFNSVLLVSNPLLSNNDVNWSTCDNLFINANFPFVATNCSYHKLGVYHRVLTDAEIVNEYNNRGADYVQPPALSTALLFDAQFNNTLVSDVGPLDFHGTASLNAGFISVKPSYHVEAIHKTFYDQFLVTTDHTWVIDFKCFSENNDRLFVQTTGNQFSQNTGLTIWLYNNLLLCTYYYGENLKLVDTFLDLGDSAFNLKSRVNQIVVTYNESGDSFGPHKMTLYWNGVQSVVTNSEVVGNVAIDWSTSNGIYLNKSFANTPGDITEFHRVSIYNRVLTQLEVSKLYLERQIHLGINPALVFDINFDDKSLLPDIIAVDDSTGFHGPGSVNDGYVSIAGTYYMEFRNENGLPYLPTYLKRQAEQTWHVAFRSETLTGDKLFLQTSPVGTSFQTSVEERTGFYLVVTGTFVQAIFFKGERDELVSVSGDIGNIDLSADINTITITYTPVNLNTTKLYFNGQLLSTDQSYGSSGVIQWDTSNSIYVNRFYNLMPSDNTDIYRIAVFDKELTDVEVQSIYEKRGVYIIDPIYINSINPLTLPVLHWDFEDLFDNINNVEFLNIENMLITNGSAFLSYVDQYLEASPLKSLLSQESATLMFVFRGVGTVGNHNIFSTYRHGHGKHRNGYLLRLVNNNIQFEINGPNLDPSTNTRTVNTLHSIDVPLIGGPNIFYNDFCHMAITFDYENNYISTYINGVLNSQTVTIQSNQLTHFHGSGDTTSVLINRWRYQDGGSPGIHKDVKIFNSCLKQEEITYYYNESIA